MFDAIFDRTDANIGTFIVTKGNVSKGTAPLLTWFNDKSVIIAMNARSAFTLPEEHQMFDQIILVLIGRGIGIMYVDSVSKFMDPKARFNEFLMGQLDPKAVGLDLNKDELMLPATYAGAKAKFDALFTAPKPDYGAGVDLAEFFTDTEITAIMDWRDGKSNALATTIKSKIDSNGQANAGLLRIVKNGNTYRVQNDQGHFVSKGRFESMYNDYIKPFWDKNAPDSGASMNRNLMIEARERGSNYNYDKRVEVYADHIEVGCQSIPRAEVEAMIGKLAAL